MISLPRTCEKCGNSMYHYGSCEKCPQPPSTDAAKDARIAELEAENRLLRARPMHKRPDFRDGIPSDEE